MLASSTHMLFMTPPLRSNQTIRLTSYNIRKAKGVDGRRDPARIIEILAGLEADVVALQEADMRWRGRPGVLCRKMIEQDSDYVLVDVARSAQSLGWHGNAILVRRGMQVDSVTRLELPGLEPRGAVRIDISLPVPLTVIATHLGLTRYHRQGQLAAIRGAVSPKTRPTAILGDFNEWSGHRGLDALHPDFTVHAPGKTFRSNLPLASLDRLALSHNISLRHAGVVQTPQSLLASDHLPIWGDVVIGEAA
jgi:endonuclease/exonuclease/phosphatase family metal-dependent hydrolase